MSSITEIGKAIAQSQAKDRKNSIPYRKEYNMITGSVEGSILLQQILYWWETSGRKPFYKFRDKSEHEKYKSGDSWIEELGFTGYQFDKAIKSIGVKITSGIPKNHMRSKALVIYWTDSNRITWYEVNEDVYALIALAYGSPESLGNFDLQKYLGIYNLGNFLDNLDGNNYLSSETTTETTQKKDSDFVGTKSVQRDEPAKEQHTNASIFRAQYETQQAINVVALPDTKAQHEDCILPGMERYTNLPQGPDDMLILDIYRDKRHGQGRRGVTKFPTADARNMWADTLAISREVYNGKHEQAVREWATRAFEKNITAFPQFLAYLRGCANGSRKRMLERASSVPEKTSPSDWSLEGFEIDEDFYK